MKPKIVELNLEGELCPYTLILAIKKSKEIADDLKAGKKILEVLVDHPPVIDNFPEEFKNRGYKVKIKKLGSARWVVAIGI
ncbi:MAG: sulfurtransferase TusA family protein [Patescibacteria group bacterium]